MRVLQQVQQRLLQLRGVGPDLAFHVALDAEVHLAAQPLEEDAPVHRLQPRRRQFGEARVVADEAFEMARALLDRGQRARQALVLAAAQQLGAGMRQRGDRRQRVVELVADHADHLLPHLHFLAAQLGGELAQQQQLVAAAVEAEQAAREVVDVLVVLVADGEHAVAAAREGVAHGLGHAFEQLGEGHALETVAVAEQLARGQVAEHDVTTGIDQQHRHRRVLHHRVEQQLALHQAQALFAQGVAERAVAGDQVSQLAAAFP